MSRASVRLAALVATLVAVLAAATPALAHGGPRGAPLLFGGTSTSALVNEAARNLGVTPAGLRDAIRGAAVARIDQAVDDGDIEAADAPDSKDEVQDNLTSAIRFSDAHGVAVELGTTGAKVNDAFRAARRAQLVARIDRAVAADDLGAADAATLKAKIAKATLPGYGNGFGLLLPGFGMGPGFGELPRPGGFGLWR